LGIDITVLNLRGWRNITHTDMDAIFYYETTGNPDHRENASYRNLLKADNFKFHQNEYYVLYSTVAKALLLV